MGELRDRKKRETRQRISDVATSLFFECGFDAVTIDEIAAAAKVSKMTVFNYFARKEELILDREDDLRLMPLRAAIRERRKGQSPVDAVRVLVDALSDERHPLARIDALTLEWWRVVEASPALRARLRELGDEAAEGLATELGGSKPEGRARLAGALLADTVRIAREEAFRLLDRGGSARRARESFGAVMNAGLAAVDALLASRA